MGNQPGLAIGVDIGGTSVKAGVVDLSTGSLAGTRVRLPTPRPPAIGAVITTVAAAVEQVERASCSDKPGAPRSMPLGVGVSGDVRDGTHTSGVNLDPSWVGAPARLLIEERLGRPVRILNDADAAGIAEVRYGAARDVSGVTIVLTFGTGIGSAVFMGGRLLPNTGFGQFPFRGGDVEQLLSAVARERRGLSLRAWADELNEFLRSLDAMLRPDLVIIGGGASESWLEFGPFLSPPPLIARAVLGNDAGIVGAAVFASDGVPDAAPLADPER